MYDFLKKKQAFVSKFNLKYAKSIV
uniref:Uncharacterized protein n=1 Tax=Ciona intestinalis TaxID=7719 RepID=H2XN14_CIOIN